MRFPQLLVRKRGASCYSCALVHGAPANAGVNSFYSLLSNTRPLNDLNARNNDKAKHHMQRSTTITIADRCAHLGRPWATPRRRASCRARRGAPPWPPPPASRSRRPERRAAARRKRPQAEPFLTAFHLAASATKPCRAELLDEDGGSRS